MPFGIGLGGGGGDTAPTTGGGGRSSPPSGSPAGGGGSGSGGSGSPTAQPGPGSGAAALLSSFMVDVVRDATDRAQYGPTIFVGPNDTVSVMPKRSNTQPCFISTAGNSDARSAGNRLQLASTDNPVSVTVRTLKEIGVYSTVVGEGVTIIVGRRA